MEGFGGGLGAENPAAGSKGVWAPPSALGDFANFR